MSCLNYWWLWKKLGGQCDAGLERWQINRPAAPPGVCLALENSTGIVINLGMPLKAHSHNRSSIPGCEACRAQSLDTGHRGVRRSGLAASESKSATRGPQTPEETSLGRYNTFAQEHQGRLHNWQQPFSFFCLGCMCIPEDTHACTHKNDQQSYTDFTSCSLWARVTFLSDFIVSVRFQLMMMILSRCLAIF